MYGRHTITDASSANTILMSIADEIVFSGAKLCLQAIIKHYQTVFIYKVLEHGSISVQTLTSSKHSRMTLHSCNISWLLLSLFHCYPYILLSILCILALLFNFFFVACSCLWILEIHLDIYVEHLQTPLWHIAHRKWDTERQGTICLILHSALAAF